MKKLSLLVALILSVTIGGVYATWYYANSQNEIKHDVSLAVGIDYSFTGTAGTLQIVVEDTLTPFAVEPLSSTDYTAQLVTKKDIKLVFTPYANASDDIKEYGIDVYWYFNNATALESCVFDLNDDGTTDYSKEKVFSYNDASGSTNSIAISKGDFTRTQTGDAITFTYDMTADLLGAIDMSNFKLINYDRYEDFSQSIQTVVFGISLTSINPNA